MTGNLELSELIEGLRAELEKARADGASADVGFEVGPVELEVTVSVSKKGTGKAGVRFWVVTAEASGELATVATQRIKLTLDPRTTHQPSNNAAGNKHLPKVPLVVYDDELPNEQQPDPLVPTQSSRTRFDGVR